MYKVYHPNDLEPWLNALPATTTIVSIQWATNRWIVVTLEPKD